MQLVKKQIFPVYTIHSCILKKPASPPQFGLEYMKNAQPLSSISFKNTTSKKIGKISMRQSFMNAKRSVVLVKTVFRSHVGQGSLVALPNGCVEMVAGAHQ